MPSDGRARSGGDALNVHFNVAATGKLVGTTDAHRIAGSTRVESLHIWPPGDKGLIQIGRFGIPYKLRRRIARDLKRFAAGNRWQPDLSTFRSILGLRSRPVYWLRMSEALRTATFLGIADGGVSRFLSAQATNSNALALEPQTGHRSSGEGAPPAAGGVNTGPPQPAQFDEQHRPITAGGFVKSGPVIFEDISEKAGLTHWTHKMGTPEKKYIIETNGSGVGLMDYDNDGWLDIYVVNGSTFDALDGKETPPHAALFHNNHDGTFTDVADKAGVTNDRWGFGVAMADYDNDGWPDIYVTNWGKNRLYHNNHDGTFTDVAEKAGVTLGNWSTGATWGDYDGDGRLDLFVPGYVHFDRNNLPSGGANGVPDTFCTFRGVAVNCGPRGLKGEPDHLFHNNGDGTFTDVSEKAGVADNPGYYGLELAVCRHQQRRQGRSAGGRRLDAQLSLSQQGRRDI